MAEVLLAEVPMGPKPVARRPRAAVARAEFAALHAMVNAHAAALARLEHESAMHLRRCAELQQAVDKLQRALKTTTE